MRRRALLLLSLPVALAGCATARPRDDVPPLLLRLPPATLGRHLALAQQLRVRSGAREFQFDALLEADDQALRLALLVHAQPMVRLHWDGTTLTQQAAPGWPTAVSAERVLSDLVLVLWPAEAVTAALPPGWSLQHDGAGRELRWRGTTAQRVRYPAPGRIELEHLVLGYRMQIDSSSLP